MTNHNRIDRPFEQPVGNRRRAERCQAALPARLTWKDQYGATRFASVVTRDISEIGVYVESYSAISIPLYRLVQFQVEREAREADRLPSSLRHGRVLSAVYRVTPGALHTAARQGLALRLMVEPKRRAVEVKEGRVSA